MKEASKIFFVSILIFSLFAIKVYPQSEFQVEFYKSRGELQKNDLYKKDFGRYKGFEIPANKGEAGSFVVYSPSFKPALILTDEKGNIIKQTAGRDEHTAILSTVFPSNGNFVLFMVADSSSRGEFDFQYGFASETSIAAPVNSGFKKEMEYLLEHAKAYFLFFEYPIEGKNLFCKIDNAEDVNIETDGSYNAVFFKGEDINAAQAKFAEYSAKLSGCFDSGWKKESSEWKQNNKVREKYILFKEKGSEMRSVKLSLFDFTNAKDTYRFSYGVTLVISKGH